MTRNLKALGLAVLAVFAMSAIAASAASANEGAKFTAAKYPAKISATGGGDKFTAFGSSVECANSTFSGELTATSTTLTITPVYTNCVAFGGPATVEMNGCTFVFHVGATTGGADTFGGLVDVACPAGKVIVVNAYLTAPNHTNKTPLCIVTIPAQTGKSGFHLTNTTSATNDVDISGTVGGLTANQDRNSFLCPAGTHTETAVYDINGNITAKGTNGGLPTSVDIG